MPPQDVVCNADALTTDINARTGHKLHLLVAQPRPHLAFLLPTERAARFVADHFGGFGPASEDHQLLLAASLPFTLGTGTWSGEAMMSSISP